MCGIVGGVSKSLFDIEKMLSTIKHRGPDGGGQISLGTKSCYNLKLGHRRLSIIDTSTNSDQPFISTNKKNYIVFNGEIYNYKELKNEYLSDFSFKSEGDTEVIIELYNRYGTESFQWLKGMFSFVIYDFNKDKIILSRDPLGIKPLYYVFQNDELFFSSEIKALKQIAHLDFTVSPLAIAEFFLNGFIYEPNTGFTNVHKVFPGTYLEFFLGDNFSFTKTVFWKPLNAEKPAIIDFNNIIKNEYSRHLVSDVPIGLFYSGGIDSSLLLSLGNTNISPFFINSKLDSKGSKELKYATTIANNLNRNFEILNISSEKKSSEDLLSTIQHVAEKSEELIADYTFYVSELISKQAKKQNFTVMLSGMGGDELFLGYPRYKLLRYRKFYKFLYLILGGVLSISRKFSKKIDRFAAFFEQKSFVFRYTNLIGYFQEDELKSLILNFDSNYLKEYEFKLNSILCGYESLSDTKKAQILDLYGFLSHNFSVADKSSMQESIEVRVPLATPDLFNACLYTDEKLLFNFNNSKIPLLNILKEKLDANLFRRPKEGFNPDLENLVSEIGFDKINLILQTPKISSYLNIEYINNLLLEHFQKHKNHSYKIYQLLYFKFWLDFNCNKI